MICCDPRFAADRRHCRTEALAREYGQHQADAGSEPEDRALRAEGPPLPQAHGAHDRLPQRYA